MTLRAGEPLAVAVTGAIRAGDVTGLQTLLAEHPSLATARIVSDECGGEQSRSLLHVVSDWPGHLPDGAAMVRALVAAGADVNARFGGAHAETPLHWAASSDDIEVLDALIEAGADIEAAGAVIGGGTPLADAVAFGQWEAARRLVELGATTTLWQAAALGLMDRVRALVAKRPEPTRSDITNALWCACHGGQRDTAEYLLERGGDINWIGHDGMTAVDAAARGHAADLVAWLRSRGAKHAEALR